MDDVLLTMRGISKSFPGVQALSKVDLNLRKGEVHALMGENGAGKSTLIKVLTGVYRSDEGLIHLDGRSIAPSSPQDAESIGISTVYQEVNLIPHLSVAENVTLGRQFTRFGFLQWGAMRKRAEQALARLDMHIDVRREVSSYSVAVQHLTAIARALDTDAQVLILDEPTSSLDEKEVAELFRIIRKLRDGGLAILFVTHFLDQMYDIADRVTVLRNGKFVCEHTTAELPRLELIARMLGRDVETLKSSLGQPRVKSEPGSKPFLEAAEIQRRGVVGPLDLMIRQGEILGLAGLLGSGRTETARMVFGIDQPDSGQFIVDGRPERIASPRKAMREGIGFCSEDRKQEGIIPNLSVRENIVLAMQSSRGILRRIPHSEQTALADHYIEALNIRTPDAEALVDNLSGGNQQKVLLARWLAMQPKLIILDEPTRGIDVGAKAEIEKLVQRCSEDGVAVLFISSELEEVVRNCHRVVVLRDRRQIGELSGESIDEHAIMEMIAS